MCLKQTPVGVGYNGSAMSSMSILERGFTNAGIYQLKALRMAVHTAVVRLLRALRTVLSASDDFPLDADEHPHPSSH